MAEKRKDKRGRILRTGESQRRDLTCQFRYKNHPKGKWQSVYAPIFGQALTPHHTPCFPTHILHTFVAELWRYMEGFTHTPSGEMPQKVVIKTYEEV